MTLGKQQCGSTMVEHVLVTLDITQEIEDDRIKYILFCISRDACMLSFDGRGLHHLFGFMNLQYLKNR